MGLSVLNFSLNNFISSLTFESNILAPASYNTAFPDSTIWLDKNCYNEPYMHYYLNHPAYKDYPVVGVSYEQAIGFCKWRTDRVKEYIRKEHRITKKLFDAKDFYYRLPTEEEWKYAVSAGVNYQHGYENLHAKIMFQKCM